MDVIRTNFRPPLSNIVRYPDSGGASSYITDVLLRLMDRRILGLALTCLMMMACVVSVPFSASESDAVDPDYSSITSLHGRVFEIPYEKDRAPISGVTVTTWTSAGKEYESYPTGDDGYFTVKFNSDVSYISFTKEEFGSTVNWNSLPLSL